MICRSSAYFLTVLRLQNRRKREIKKSIHKRQLRLNTGFTIGLWTWFCHPCRRISLCAHLLQRHHEQVLQPELTMHEVLWYAAISQCLRFYFRPQGCCMLLVDKALRSLKDFSNPETKKVWGLQNTPTIRTTPMMHPWWSLSNWEKSGDSSPMYSWAAICSWGSSVGGNKRHWDEMHAAYNCWVWPMQSCFPSEKKCSVYLKQLACKQGRLCWWEGHQNIGVGNAGWLIQGICSGTKQSRTVFNFFNVGRCDWEVTNAWDWDPARQNKPNRTLVKQIKQERNNVKRCQTYWDTKARQQKHAARLCRAVD